MGPLNVLIVDDELNIRKTLTIALETDGHKVTAVSNVQDAQAQVARRSFDLAFVDLRLGTDDGLDLIPLLLATSPWLKVIVITAYASIDTAVEAMRRGATHYIPKPFTPAQSTWPWAKSSTSGLSSRRSRPCKRTLGVSIPRSISRARARRCRRP